MLKLCSFSVRTVSGDVECHVVAPEFWEDSSFNGFYSKDSKYIHIYPGALASKTKFVDVLAHEISHHILHDRLRNVDLSEFEEETLCDVMGSLVKNSIMVDHVFHEAVFTMVLRALGDSIPFDSKWVRTDSPGGITAFVCLRHSNLRDAEGERTLEVSTCNNGVVLVVRERRRGFNRIVSLKAVSVLTQGMMVGYISPLMEANFCETSLDDFVRFACTKGQVVTEKDFASRLFLTEV